MSNYDWEEVKKLAADFQRAQLTSSSQRFVDVLVVYTLILNEFHCLIILLKFKYWIELIFHNIISFLYMKLPIIYEKNLIYTPKHCYIICRLSEKNCVEIIQKLLHLKYLDVVFTNDGKSYITPKYLIKEIKDELYVHGGT